MATLVCIQIISSNLVVEFKNQKNNLTLNEACEANLNADKSHFCIRSIINLHKDSFCI